MGAYSNLALQSQHLRDLPKQIETSQARKPTKRLRRQKVPRRLSNEETGELCSNYLSGATVYELATKFDVHRLTVSAILERHGIPRRMQSLTSDQIEDAVNRYRSGQSLSEVGEQLSCSPETVRRALNRIGEPMRGQTQAANGR